MPHRSLVGIEEIPKASQVKLCCGHELLLDMFVVFVELAITVVSPVREVASSQPCSKRIPPKLKDNLCR